MAWSHTDIAEPKQPEEALTSHVAELAHSSADLERCNDLAVGRELRMIELKREINGLSQEAGKVPPYDLSFLQESSGRHS